MNEYAIQHKVQQSPMNPHMKATSAHYDRRIVNKVTDSQYQNGIATP